MAPLLGPIPSRDTSQRQEEEAPAASSWVRMHVSSSAPRTDWSLLFQSLPPPVICSELTTSRKPSVSLKLHWAIARSQGKVDTPHLPALSSEGWFPECAQHSSGSSQDQWLSEKAGPRAMDQMWSHLCAQSRKYTKSYRGTRKKKTKGYSANANSVT